MQDRIQGRGLQRKDRIPPGQKPIDRWPTLHYNSVPTFDTDNWHLEMKGLVHKPLSMNLHEFESLPQVRLISDAHCVDGWSILDNRWKGVPTKALKDIACILPQARFVVVRSGDGFSTNLSLEDFFAFDSILATHHNELPLNMEHGYPVRLIVSGLYFWKSAKWVTSIEFTSQDRPGFWEGRGYHNHGDPWLEERFA